MNKDFFRSVFDQFPYGTIQDAATIMRLMIDHDFSMEEFIGANEKFKQDNKLLHFEVIKNRRIAFMEMKMKARRCPQCGAIMNLSPVNTVSGDQVGGSWKSMWMCSDVFGCGHEIYSEAEMVVEAEKHGIQGKVADPRRRRNRASRQKVTRYNI